MKIDLNCDMGEGCGNDAALMEHISSTNIACGFHAGDTETMKRTVEMAIEKGVAIGAHPGYRDRENFGRTAMHLSAAEVVELVTVQIAALSEIAIAAGGRLDHVKPHGALYNQAARDTEVAAAIAEAVIAFDRDLILYGLSGSVSISAAVSRGLRTASEVFADRTYKSDGSLTPRSEPNALITDAKQAVAQVLQMVKNQTVTATDGTTIPIVADTICVHGDGAHALEFAKMINRSLRENGIDIGPI
jgi:UPF0271 protein